MTAEEVAARNIEALAGTPAAAAEHVTDTLAVCAQTAQQGFQAAFNRLEDVAAKSNTVILGKLM